MRTRDRTSSCAAAVVVHPLRHPNPLQSSRRAIVTAVLPVWQQTCRTAGAAAAAAADAGAASATYAKDMAAASPFCGKQLPGAGLGLGLYRAHLHAVQVSRRYRRGEGPQAGWGGGESVLCFFPARLHASSPTTHR